MLSKYLLPKYLLPIAAGATVLLGIATTVQTYRLEAARTRADIADAETGRLRIAALGSEETITRQQEALEAFRKAAIADHAAVSAAARALDAYKGVMKAQADRLAELEAQDYDNPDCNALLALDLARVCPAHASGVHQRAAGGVPGSSAGGADPRP